MIASDLPALWSAVSSGPAQWVLPLAAGLVAASLPWPWASWVVGLLGVAAGATLAAWRYAVGGEDAWTLLIAALGVLAMVAAAPQRRADSASGAVAQGLAAAGVGLAMALSEASDAFLVFVLIAALGALASVATAAAIETDRRAAPAALAQILMAILAAAVALAGAGLIRAVVGGFDLGALAAAMAGPTPPMAGLALILLALAAAAGLAPLHAAGAEAADRAFIETAPTYLVLARLGAFAALARFAALADHSRAFQIALAALGALSLISGAFGAVGAREIRKLATHAFTAQLGCALLLLAAGGEISGALFIAAQGAIVCFVLVIGAGAGGPLTGLNGLWQGRPVRALALAGGALALAGAPFSAAFAGRWLAVDAAIGHGWYWAAALVAIAAFATVFAAGQIVERLFFHPPTEERIGAASLLSAPALVAGLAALFALGLGGARFALAAFGAP